MWYNFDLCKDTVVTLRTYYSALLSYYYYYYHHCIDLIICHSNSQRISYLITPNTMN